MPSDSEFTSLETLLEMLKSVLTDALAGGKQVTASAVIPVLNHINEILSPSSNVMTEIETTTWSGLHNQYS